MIVARKDFPASNLREFVAYLKQNGDNVKQAHGGIGSSSHMACMLFAAEAGVTPNLVAYRGTGPAMNDLIGGHVDFFCEQAVSVTGQITSGAVKALRGVGDARLATLPDVPTAQEAGVNYHMNIWAGIFAPKGLPPEIVKRLDRRARPVARRRKRAEAPRRPRRHYPGQGRARAGQSSRLT